MGLKDQLFISGSWTDAAVRGNNVSGTPLTSAVATGTGEEISDVYTLSVSGRTGGTGTVTVNCDSPNNPYDGAVFAGTNFDGATAYTNIVPGTSLVFAVAGANGNSATVTIGDPYGDFDASGVGAGTPTTGVQHRVLNDGASDVTGAKARLLTQAVMVRITNKVFNYIKPFASGATEKTAGGGSNQVTPYALTISGVSGSGPSKVATLSVDGVALGAASILDLTTGASVSGTGLKAISPAYAYRIQTGPLSGLEFGLDSGVANTDKANILIFNSRYVQIAPDVSGVAGTYGTADVDLTESGESTGVITGSGVAYFWVRFLVPASANNESNPYLAKIAIAANQSTAAGWEI
jgi:hypothetical protein